MVFSQPRMMQLLFVIRNRTWFLFVLGLSRGWTCFVHKRLLPHLFAGSLRFASSHDLQADCSSKCLWRSFISLIFLHSRSKPIKLDSPLSTLFRSSSRSSSFKFPLGIFGHETFRSVGYATAEPSIEERQWNKQCRLNYNLLQKETVKEWQQS